jgi:hypothetical protein
MKDTKLLAFEAVKLFHFYYVNKQIRPKFKTWSDFVSELFSEN